jgi:hypothetical protein
MRQKTCQLHGQKCVGFFGVPISAYRLSPPTPGEESLLSKPRLITPPLPLLSTETPLDPTPRMFGPESATGPAFVTPAPHDFGTRESGVETPPAKNCPFLWEVAIGMLLASCWAGSMISVQGVGFRVATGQDMRLAPPLMSHVRSLNLW